MHAETPPLPDAEALGSGKRKTAAAAAADSGGSTARRTKKGRRGRRTANVDSLHKDGAATPPQELVAVSPLPANAEILQEGKRPVMLSKVDKSPQLVVGEDRRTATSCKGYRMARATHGAHRGTWYFEVEVRHLGTSGHARVGWATRAAELQAPVGYDHFGYSYRDLQGSKVHKALRQAYGEPYREGDVIGCLMHMPPGGRPLNHTRADARMYKGAPYVLEAAEDATPQPLPGSWLVFSRNGKPQGVAYRNILEGTYYPAVSLYTLPEQAEGATLTLNFGPDFAHSPPEVEGCTSRPACELSTLVDESDDIAAPPSGAALVQSEEQRLLNGVSDGGGTIAGSKLPIAGSELPIVIRKVLG